MKSLIENEFSKQKEEKNRKIGVAYWKIENDLENLKEFESFLENNNDKIEFISMGNNYESVSKVRVFLQKYLYIYYYNNQLNIEFLFNIEKFR